MSITPLINIYSLGALELGKGLAALVEKCINQNIPLVVCASLEEEAAIWSQKLWRIQPGSFLAHGCRSLDPIRDDYPVWVTTNPEDRPNGARTLLSVAPCIFLPVLPDIERYFLLVPPAQDQEVAQRLGPLSSDQSVQWWRYDQGRWGKCSRE